MKIMERGGVGEKRRMREGKKREEKKKKGKINEEGERREVE